MEKQLINILLEAEIERQDILCGLLHLFSLFMIYQYFALIRELYKATRILLALLLRRVHIEYQHDLTALYQTFLTFGMCVIIG